MSLTGKGFFFSPQNMPDENLGRGTNIVILLIANQLIQISKKVEYPYSAVRCPINGYRIIETLQYQQTCYGSPDMQKYTIPQMTIQLLFNLNQPTNYQTTSRTFSKQNPKPFPFYLELLFFHGPLLSN